MLGRPKLGVAGRTRQKADERKDEATMALFFLLPEESHTNARDCVQSRIS